MSSIHNLTQRIAAALNGLSASAARKRDQQARAQLPSALSTARAQVEGVKSYVASLPLAVGPAAHQWICQAEAELRYAESLQATDAAAALARAGRASALAKEAAQAAWRDANAGTGGYGRGMGGFGGGAGGFGRPGGRGGAFATGLGAGILGGVVGDMLFGGGGFGDREYGDDGESWASDGGDFGGGGGDFSGGGGGDFGGGGDGGGFGGGGSF